MVELLDKIKKKIVPDEDISKEIKKKLDKINLLLKKIKAKAVLGGSFAKNTYLKNDFDVDIFVKFDKKYADKDISNILEKAIKSLKPEKVHGSRDYFQINGKISYEIVPVLDVTDIKDARNVTDMSPLHVDWVKKNLKKDQNNEIRLAKLFCKANNIYGAESYIQGISGHVLDILIIKYGSFIKFLEAATKWKEKEVIDFYNFYKGTALKDLNKSKIQSPIIVIDPISPDRNAAAALGREKFLLLKKAARDFLETPSEDSFKREIMTKNILLTKKAKNKLLIFKVTAKEGKKDVVGSKLLKTFNYINNKFINNSFTIIDSGWEWEGKSMFWYIAKYEMLEKEFLRVGPPLKQTYHVELFKSKHKETIQKEDRIFAKVKRKYRKIEKLAEELLKSDSVLEKVKKIELEIVK